MTTPLISHSYQLIHTFLAKNEITTVRQSLYSPDLAAPDFWLFPKLLTTLRDDGAEHLSKGRLPEVFPPVWNTRSVG